MFISFLLSLVMSFSVSEQDAFWSDYIAKNTIDCDTDSTVIYDRYYHDDYIVIRYFKRNPYSGRCSTFYMRIDNDAILEVNEDFFGRYEEDE